MRLIIVLLLAVLAGPAQGDPALDSLVTRREVDQRFAELDRRLQVMNEFRAALADQTRTFGERIASLERTAERGVINTQLLEQLSSQVAVLNSGGSVYGNARAEALSKLIDENDRAVSALSDRIIQIETTARAALVIWQITAAVIGTAGVLAAFFWRRAQQPQTRR